MVLPQNIAGLSIEQQAAALTQFELVEIQMASQEMFGLYEIVNGKKKFRVRVKARRQVVA
jgi:hypothetical protein